MAARESTRSAAVCGVARRDGSPCRGAASNAWGGRCEHHGMVAIGAELGWRVRGSRRAGVYVAERGRDALVADSASELLKLIGESEGESVTGTSWT
jgi:hypothetical protein